MTLVGYLSHPIGPADRFEAMSARYDNLDNASTWLRFLIGHTRWAIMCPWLAYTVAVGSELYGPRALTDQITLLERCDLLIQVGGWISPHMMIEMNHARSRKIEIVNLTEFGFKPDDEERIAERLITCNTVLKTAKPRRVWMPPLDERDIDALRAAQVTLQDNPMAQDARDVIQRIIVAAMRK